MTTRMTTPAAFGITPDTLPRDETFVPVAQQEPTVLWTPQQIDTFATAGATLMTTLFGANEAAVKQTLQADYATLAEVYAPDTEQPLVPIVGLTLGEEGSDWISPSQLIAARKHHLRASGLPELTHWDDMYTDRSPAWWNRRRTDDSVTKIGSGMIHGLVVVDELHGTTENWKNQQKRLKKLIDQNQTDTTTQEGLSIVDWNLWDAAAVDASTKPSNNHPRPDTQTFNRFPQHQMDRIDAGDPCGPRARVGGDRAGLGRSYGDADSSVGFRVVVGLTA